MLAKATRLPRAIAATKPSRLYFMSPLLVDCYNARQVIIVWRTTYCLHKTRRLSRELVTPLNPSAKPCHDKHKHLELRNIPFFLLLFMRSCRLKKENTTMKITQLANLGRRIGRQAPRALTAICAVLLCRLILLNATGSELQETRGSKSDAERQTALDRYIAAPDTNYVFKKLTSAPTELGTIHIVEMTSQAWLTTNEVNHTLWKHWLAIACPKQITNTTGLLFITGGSNDKESPNTPEAALRQADANLVRMAVETRSVVAELHNVPNQPLIFDNDGQPRSEDKLIAYTWDKFLRTGDERWPARLPMTKAAVRAMDTVTAFCASADGGGTKVDRFVVSGGSKRGWTTWTTAAVDKRVIAIAPIVIDVLNIEPSMRHHYAAYGFWAPAIHDYAEQHIMDWTGTAQYKALAVIEDPYEYRQRYTMPKLILNDTGDQFFLPDSSRFYYDELPGPKYIRYVPNTDHSMRGSDAWETVQAFYEGILAGKQFPRFSWTFEKDGSIRVEATDAPKGAKLWQATNPDARDFRLETLGPKWSSTPLTFEGGICIGRVAEPTNG